MKDDASGRFRAHVGYIYDDENTNLGGGDKPALPSGQTSFNLVVETRYSATGTDMLSEYDSTLTRNEYGAVVIGDGNGWTLGTPTQVKTQLADGSWSIQVTRYDTQGRQIETRQPGGGTASDGSGNDAHATTMSYYATSAADSDCATVGHSNRSSWVGLPCKTGPAGQPSGPPMPVTYTADYNDDLQPTRVEDSSGGTSRILTTSYDAIGRPVGMTITDGNDTRTATIGFNTSTGLPTTQSGDGGTVATVYDSWGRPWQYTDATGLTSTTTYTIDSQVATLDDGEGTYTYGYDGGSGEHRRLPTSVDIGMSGELPDTFTLDYDTAGAQSSVTFPNGMVATNGYDELGVPTSLDYTDSAGQNLLSFNATVDVEGRVVASTSTASHQDYSFDQLRRLTQVQDTRSDGTGDQGCATRRYGFSAASERTTFSAYAPDPTGACQTSTPTVSETNTYDTANRIRNAGYTYDNLGRTLTTPAADTALGAAGPLTATYFANDMRRLADPVNCRRPRRHDLQEHVLRAGPPRPHHLSHQQDGRDGDQSVAIPVLRRLRRTVQHRHID